MFNTQELKAALDKLTVISPTRTTLPILKYLLLKTENDTLKISACDIVKSLTINIKNADSDINTCVPATELRDIVATVQSEKIKLEQVTDKLILYDGKHKTTFKCLDANKFPAIGNFIESFTLDGDILQTCVKRTVIACSNDESHAILTGINLRGNNGIFTVQAADGFRASHIKMLLGVSDFDVTIKQIDRKIMPLFNGILSIAITDKQVAIFNNYFVYTSQLIAGNFPEIIKMIPTTKNTTIVIEKAVLSNAVRRAMVFAKNTDNIITFSLINNSLDVSSEDDTGQNSLQFSVQQTGSDVRFAISGQFVHNFLTIASESIIIELIDNQHPVVFKMPDSETFIHVIMPMQIR